MEEQKELQRATYQITKVIEEYVIQGQITYNENNEIVEMQMGRISKNGEHVATFNEIGVNLVVRFMATLPTAEQKQVIDLIDAFRK